MAMLLLSRFIVPVWFVVVGLIGAFQPPVTMTANILLLGVGGIVVPMIWLFAIHRCQRAKPTV